MERWRQGEHLPDVQGLIVGYQKKRKNMYLKNRHSEGLCMLTGLNWKRRFLTRYINVCIRGLNPSP